MWYKLQVCSFVCVARTRAIEHIAAKWILLWALFWYYGP